ncbi:MAG TPA: glycoside hydrolase family 36 N-terminal domain-containing protein, partial [Xylanibacter oryzae]|nr:glycoside hydrolase family 36 N-terminal domain-containing protein [Xylanibacter oryzae]
MKKLTFIFVALLSMTANVWSKTNIVISTDNTQLILQVKENGRLYQTYLGERLADGTDLDLLDMPRTNVTQTQTKGNEVYPVMGTEDYFEPAMEIRHVDGNATSILKYISHSSKAINGGTETIIKLKDDLYPVNVTLHFAAYEKDNIIKEWTEISHNENGLVSLSRYASS